MKTFVIVSALLAASAPAPAQTPAKAPAQSAGLGKSGAGSNEDKNIRAYIELLRTDIKKGKSQLMGEVMQLETEQSVKFWPIYKEFEAEFATLGDKVLGVIKTYAENYDKMSDTVADNVATQLLQVEHQRHELKQKYYGRFKAAVGAITAARFLQVENQLERLIDLQIASELPVISR
jgi:flagellar biosynthesis chaperone FliJ